MPKLDGNEVLKEIRKDNREIKIIILSARSEVEDKVIGLDLGANDYLAKPFHFKELEARVRALLRRDFLIQPSVLTSMGLSLNTSNKKVIFDGEEVILTKKEYAILECLMLNKGKVISGEELIEHVWDCEVNLFTNAFKVHINALRKKLPKDFIKNVRGSGYYVE